MCSEFRGLYNNAAVICPLCQRRKARRACPALGKTICTVCCGTKRQVEIQCPKDCIYLTTAREHPPAAAVRKQQRDVGSVVRFMQDLDDRQSRLFFLVLTFLVRYPAPELQPLIDEDVADALGALAATFETSSRGVIYEHRPRSMAAERLASAVKPVLDEADSSGGTAFERDAAVVLRRIEAAARAVSHEEPGNRRAFVELLTRIIERKDEPSAGLEPTEEAPRLIIP
jgi:hypothetical protein